MFIMNKLSPEKRRAVVACLVEGNSLRATSRMTGVSLNTVTKLLSDLGTVCSVHMDKLMRGLYCEKVQCDEIWSFVGAKAKNVKPDKREQGWGDAWTWVAMDAGSKLVITYRVGPRDPAEAHAFMHDLAGRLRYRVQLTTDGHRPYLRAVQSAFADDIDYAMLIKIYGTDQDSRKPERRYSPGVCIEAIPQVVTGDPDPDHISTSHVERQNLTMRMSMRRFTRLTNGFSKKVENHAAAISLHFMHYNFCRVHKTLGTTPAVAAGVVLERWTIDDLIVLLDDAERAVPRKRGPYKKRVA
jgi:IS1 family transposase